MAAPGDLAAELIQEFGYDEAVKMMKTGSMPSELARRLESWIGATESLALLYELDPSRNVFSVFPAENESGIRTGFYKIQQGRQSNPAWRIVLPQFMFTREEADAICRELNRAAGVLLDDPTPTPPVPEAL